MIHEKHVCVHVFVNFLFSTRPLLAFTIEIVHISLLGLLLVNWIGLWTHKMLVNIASADIIIAKKHACFWKNPFL